MGKKFVVTRGYEGCLVIVDEDRWNRIVKEIVGGTFIDKKIRDAGRFLIAGASEVECDEQGRFVIPANLVDFAELEEEVIFLGLVNWVEIWSKSRWTEHEEYVSENSESIAQEIANIVNNKTGA